MSSDLRSLSINGELLLYSEIRARAASLRLQREANGQQASLDERVAMLEEARNLLIDRMLLVREARRLALDAAESEIDAVLAEGAKRFDGISGCRAGADTPEARHDIRCRLMIDKVLEHWRGTVRRPRLAELQNYYRGHKESFHQPEMVHASHIVRHFESAADGDDVPAQVEALRVRVLGGAGFGQVAAAHSDCPENEGDLGWFARGVMVKEFDDVVFATPAAELTPVFRTEFGVHFALVHARKPAGLRPFAEVRPLIEESLWLSKQDHEVGRALAELQANATIRSQA